MADLTTSRDRFVDFGSLPSVAAETPLRLLLENRPRNGVIVTQRGAPTSFLQLDNLVNDLVSSGRANELFEAPLGHVLSYLPQGSTPIETTVLQPGAAAPKDDSFKIYQVGSDAKGWYFTDQGRLVQAMKRVVYVCANGHKNNDPDGGTCYSCPFPVHAEVEDP
jgi:hypothetical protein